MISDVVYKERQVVIGKISAIKVDFVATSCVSGVEINGNKDRVVIGKVCFNYSCGGYLAGKVCYEIVYACG